ncbi:unnamed protein product [Prorocentrum cordatum]|uniref:Uncharacterized protein n=1 Tax=Prorocentrum cordatum TaxID=2364126 RepID=A0ABN9V7B8_9DINO|nr:unnamed protein product [Polarella glacialis]
MMSRALLDSAASLATTSASSAIAESSGPPKWVWERELEAMCSRVSRVRAEEANELRRSAEEAERGALRRIEEVERRMLRCQADEGEALQRFLAGWGSALDLRLPHGRQRAAAALSPVSWCYAYKLCSLRSALGRTGRGGLWRQSGRPLGQARVEALETGGDSLAQKLAGVAVQVNELGAGVMDQMQRQQQAQASSLQELAAQQAALQREAAAERAPLRQEATALGASLQELRDGLERRWRESDTRHEAAGAECRAARQEAAAGSAALTQVEARLRAADEAAARLSLELRGTAEAEQQAVSAALARLEERCTAIAQEEARRLEEWCDARCSEAARSAEALAARRVEEALADSDGRLPLHSAGLREAAEAGQAARGPPRHDWRIARCMQRLEYLSLTSEAGLWLDSEDTSPEEEKMPIPLPLRLFSLSSAPVHGVPCPVQDLRHRLYSGPPAA